MTVIRSTIAAAMALSACAAAAPAFAMDPNREVVQLRIAYADLNLAHPAGRAALKNRIDRAVRRACAATLAGARGGNDATRCRDEMMRDADVQVAALNTGAPVKLAASR
ncbi:UrcA family protein [Sphingomonas sp. KR1UV-12]|uniref:UrcA family protein n=1 Tax=Sphingomonas aurea TaxID=3063994 RepID=A0ABT9EI76_9SPHN|nr:UrcA family protein [Sphingomonas sp. KR1UV-12]MDP1026542.1 UrcA family protein [Sphingomonas sp. KR1UV-12]